MKHEKPISAVEAALYCYFGNEYSSTSTEQRLEALEIIRKFLKRKFNSSIYTIYWNAIAFIYAYPEELDIKRKEIIDYLQTEEGKQFHDQCIKELVQMDYKKRKEVT